jgi:hypothetical protein
MASAATIATVSIPLDDLRLRWTLICSKVRRDDLLESLDLALAELAKRDRAHPPHPDTLAGIVEYATEKLEDLSLTLALLRAVHTYAMTSSDEKLSTPIPPGYMKAIVLSRPTTPTPESQRKSEAELIAAGEGKGKGKGKALRLILIAVVLLAIAGAAVYLLVLKH